MDQAAGTVKRWHVDAWPPLAWLETVIKLIALGIGLVTPDRRTVRRRFRSAAAASGWDN